MELKIFNKQVHAMIAIAWVSGEARNTVRKYVRHSATATRKVRVSRLDLHWDRLIAQLEHIHRMMSAKLIQLRPNAATAGAIGYLLKRWCNFTR